MPTLVDSIALVELGDALWRVTRPDGDVLGYVESFETSGGTRYRAKRMLTSQRRFVPIGDFWVMGDAVDCFR
jgi:hypothetical protein